MKSPRTIAGLVTAGLIGAATVGVAAPAQAATVTTTATLTTSTQAVVYGDDVSFSGGIAGVDAATGATKYVSAGVASLQVLSAANPTWTTVATDDSPSSLYFYDVKPQAKSQYKVVYSGGASTTDTFTPSESVPVSIGVQRKVDVSIQSAKLTLKLKVKPDFKKKKIKVFIKKNGKYKLLKKVKSNKKGKASITLPAPKRGGKLYFRIKVPGDANFLPFQDEYYTYTS